MLFLKRLLRALPLLILSPLIMAASLLALWLADVFSFLVRAARPPARVAQLALPAFTRMARATPRDARRCSRASSTGAACTRLRVNIAAAEAGVSERIRARSSFFSFRMPA